MSGTLLHIQDGQDIISKYDSDKRSQKATYYIPKKRK